jgi:2-polyprenyl-3-methyl-5-hydroxy-6-metoxy-1,4-benzoquinol methylase
VLTLTDAAQCWKHLGIAELAFILPKLAGCLVVLNIHPVNFSVTDDGVAFTSQKADCSDHGLLEALGWIGDSIPLPEAEPVYRHGPHLEAIKYSGAPEYLIDWTQLTPQYVCPELGHKEIKKLDEVILQLNQKLNCGGWFNKLINTPNEMILALIHEQWPKENRSEAKVLEVCGGLGPVAIGLTHLGFRPENMTVTDVNASFMTLAKAISHTLFEDKIKTAVVDVRDIQLPDTYDIIVIAGWEDMSLPYDIVVEQCTKVLSPNGILVMTFLEETRILSEGYSFSPDRLLQKKPYFTVTPDSLYFYMERSGLKPEIYVDYGYPVNRFPRHLMVGRRQPVLTSLHREFKSHFHALQQLLNVEAQPIDWSSFLNIPPLSGGRTLKDLSQSELTHVLSQAIRKMTFHPYMDWNLDVMVIHDWDESTALAALLAGQGNKCGAVANITHTLLNAFGIPCRILLCQGYSELLESSVSHLLTEVYLEGAWRILDNDVFQFSDWQFQNEAGEWLTRDQVLQAGLTHWMQVAPNPYTYPALSTDETWLRKNWTAWFNAISGEVSIYKPTPHVSE